MDDLQIGDMPAISLHQPWASFIAIGAKPFETRSWAPPAKLIGRRIAIHAAKKPITGDDCEWARRLGVDKVPLGAVVCTAVLAGAYQISPSDRDAVVLNFIIGSPPCDHVSVDDFGDYAHGRWAWLLMDVVRLDPPIQARGAQGFWRWVPEICPACGTHCRAVMRQNTPTWNTLQGYHCSVCDKYYGASNSEHSGPDPDHG